MTALVKLGDVIDIVAGQHIMSALYNESGEGTPYLTGPADFGDESPTVTKWTTAPKSFSKAGDVLITVKGNGVGKTNLGIDACISRQLMALRPIRGKLISRYLFHFLRSREARIFALAQGATVPGIGKKEIAGIELPLPEPSAQRRIADILDKADAIRRKRKEAITLTEDLLRSAFLDMVGPCAKAYDTWPEASFESLAVPEKGSMRTGPFGSDLKHSEFVDEGVAVLGIDNAVQNRFAWGERRFITHKKYERLTRYTVRPHDVIVTIMGTTGRSAVVPADIPLAITTKHLATITLNRDVAEPEFVAQAIHRHPAILAQIQQANRGAIMSGLNLGLIKSLVVRVPPIEIQRSFGAFTKRLRDSMENHEAARSESEDLFGSLVARAFSGKLGAPGVSTTSTKARTAS